MSQPLTQLRAQRSMHLIDIENLVGAGRPSPDQVRLARARYLSVVPLGPTDQVVIAMAHCNALAVYAAWPEARVLCRSGKDGADLALAEAIFSEHIGSRFGVVYVASGDHGLARPVAQLAAEGAHTIAVSSQRSLSREIRLAAHEVLLLPPTPTPLPAVRSAVGRGSGRMYA